MVIHRSYGYIHEYAHGYVLGTQKAAKQMNAGPLWCGGGARKPVPVRSCGIGRRRPRERGASGASIEIYSALQDRNGLVVGNGAFDDEPRQY